MKVSISQSRNFYFQPTHRRTVRTEYLSFQSCNRETSIFNSVAVFPMNSASQTCFNLAIEKLLFSTIGGQHHVNRIYKSFNLAIEKLLFSTCLWFPAVFRCLRFNLAIEKLLFSTSFPRFSNLAGLAFQSRNRETSIFNSQCAIRKITR